MHASLLHLGRVLARQTPRITKSYKPNLKVALGLNQKNAMSKGLNLKTLREKDQKRESTQNLVLLVAEEAFQRFKMRESPMHVEPELLTYRHLCPSRINCRPVSKKTILKMTQERQIRLAEFFKNLPAITQNRHKNNRSISSAIGRGDQVLKKKILSIRTEITDR